MVSMITKMAAGKLTSGNIFTMAATCLSTNEITRRQVEKSCTNLELAPSDQDQDIYDDYWKGEPASKLQAGVRQMSAAWHTYLGQCMAGG